MDSRLTLTPKQLAALRAVATFHPKPVAIAPVCLALLPVKNRRLVGPVRASVDHRLRTLERRGFVVRQYGTTPYDRHLCYWTLGPLSDALVERGVL